MDEAGDRGGIKMSAIGTRGRIIWLAVAAVLLGLFGYGAFVAYQDAKPWAGVPGAHRVSTEMAIGTLLDPKLTSRRTVEEGTTLQVAWFRRPHDGLVRVWVHEVDFGDTSLSRPLPKPRPRTLLVSSVDEMQRVDGGLSGKIGRGCGLSGYEGHPLTPGAINLLACKGVYQTQIKDVANAGIITWNRDKLRAKKPCLEEYQAPDENAYVTCVRGMVKEALEAVFEARDPDDGHRYQALLLPAIGTGIGPLDKGEFNEITFKAISNALITDGGRNLPDDIYLQVWAGDDPDSFARTIDGISTGADEAIDAWRAAAKSNRETGWLLAAGVAGGLGLVVLLRAVTGRFAALAPQLDLSAPNGAALQLVALVIVSYGLASGVDDIIPPIETYGAVLKVALGFVVALFAAPLAAALEAANEKIKQGSAGMR